MSGWRFVLSALALVALPALADTAEAPPKIAIIIDDMGYGLAVGERALHLPGPVAYAVLPATPRGRTLAEQAYSSGREVLLHLPLQSTAYDQSNDPGKLELDMTRHQFVDMFEADLVSVPHVIGINSHRGSLLTRHPGHMAWLMEEIRRRGNLFFVDSYTTHESVALDLAREAGVPAVRRDVFLDPDPAPATIAREFARLKDLARQRGFAMGIGHPYPATLELLENALPTLADEGFELVSISRYILLKNGRRMPEHDVASGE